MICLVGVTDVEFVAVRLAARLAATLAMYELASVVLARLGLFTVVVTVVVVVVELVLLLLLLREIGAGDATLVVG